MDMIPGVLKPQGVDLDLGKFNLSVPVHKSGQVAVHESVEAGLAISSAFLASLENGFTEFTHDHQGLLKEIFHPSLSDRRNEGQLFVPPDTRSEYLERLLDLIKKETKVRQRRKESFCR